MQNKFRKIILNSYTLYSSNSNTNHRYFAQNFHLDGNMTETESVIYEMAKLLPHETKDNMGELLPVP